MSTNYQRGRAREYRCQDALRDAGYVTTRAASSQGAFDIVAVSPDAIRLIQCKSGGAYVSRKDRAVLETLAGGLRGKASVEIWRYPDRCREPFIEVL